LLELLGKRLGAEMVADRMRERFVATRRPILDGQLEQLRRLDSLTAETPLERRPSVIADLSAVEKGVLLTFEGKWISFPARVADELELVVEATGRFTASGLPGGLDDAGRLVLVRRLIREGFLRARYDD
jgi:hypothetical protein